MKHVNISRVIAFAAAVVVPLAAISAGQTPGARAADPGFRGIELRSLGPSMATGRMADFAVDPRDPAVWYIGVASGGVWNSVNHGLDWTPRHRPCGRPELPPPPKLRRTAIALAKAATSGNGGPSPCQP